MKYFKLFAALIFLIGVAAFPACLHASPPMVKPAPVLQPLSIKTKDKLLYTLNVELAVTDEQQKTGLMNRTALDDKSGMLFIFDDIAQRDFWMKDTLIPLDMIFIAKDGTIDHIHHMAKPQDETRITSDKPFKAVLEVKGGLTGKLGIHKGDVVLYEAFRNTLAK